MEKLLQTAEAAAGRKLSACEKVKLRRKAQQLMEAREVRFFTSAEALRASAELSRVERQEQPQDWLKIIWYGDECGGKLIRFKSGCPYAYRPEKVFALPDERSEDERAAARLSQSMSRTKRRIYEIAACNPWTWFFTGTLDGAKCDREDLNGTFKRLSQFVRDYRKRTGHAVKYLIVPELHKDGKGWHFHGLLEGLPREALHAFELSERIPRRLKRTIRGGTPVYEWREYSAAFGYTTLTEVRSKAATAAYVTKYITKDMAAANVGSGRKMYYCSQGLARPVTLAEGESVTGLLPRCDFENDYVATRSLDAAEAEAVARMYLGVDIRT